MIKNIIFDIGNVIVKWDPKLVVKKTFPQEENIDALVDKICKDSVWSDLNVGKVTEKEAITHYSHVLQKDTSVLEVFMYHVKETQTLLPGSVDLIKNLYDKGYNLYILSDNVREIIHYFKKKYDFFQYFKGEVISADVGFLKPSKEIYDYLLTHFHLIPQETLFFDDLEKNIIGAKNCGIHAIQFTSVEKAIFDLKSMDIL